MYFAPAGFFKNQFRSILGVFIIGESRLPGDEYTGESRLHGGEYTGESVMNMNNPLNIRKNSNSFLACLTELGEII
jgi:hypothetical protein